MTLRIISTLVLSIVCFSLSNFTQAQTFLNESFNSGIPASWTVVDGGNSTDTWTASINGRSGSFLNGSEFIYVDSDANGSGVVLFETIETPFIDATTASSLFFVEFEQYFEEFGPINDSVWVEVYDGNNWNQIYFNDQTVGSWNNPDRQMINIEAYRNDSLKVRFGYTDNGGWGYFYSVDNVRIFSIPVIDVGVVGMDSIASSCSLDSFETIGLTVVNFGSDTLIPGTLIPVTIDVDGNLTTENITLTDSLFFYDTLSYTFTSSFVFNVEGEYTLKIYSSIPGDGDSVNDTLFTSVTHIPYVSSFPYFEDFELGKGGWVSSTFNSSWEFGNPIGSVINDASSGTNAWVTNLDGHYYNDEYSYLYSNCFDFSALAVDPVVRFDYIFENQSCCDGSWIEYSKNGGTTWIKLQSGPTTMNWYNEPFTKQWKGSQNSWNKGKTTLTGLAGEASIQFRFVMSSSPITSYEGFGMDDFEILDSLKDVTMVAITSPTTSCDLDSNTTISISVKNMGNYPIWNVPVCYQVSGGGSICDTITDTISVGQTVNFTFDSLSNLSAIQAFTIDVTLSLSGDAYTTGDLMSKTVNHIASISTFPYLQDFDGTNDGWVSSGTSPSWEIGIPTGTNLNSAFSGTNTLNTNNNGNYNTNEFSYLSSPCIDFSNEVSDLTLKFSSKFLLDSLDNYWVEISVDSGQTFTKLGTYGDGINWYNDNSSDVYLGSSENNGLWLHSQIQLTGTAGNGRVLVRYVIKDSGSGVGEGISIDDFRLGIPENISLNLGNDTSSCDTIDWYAPTGYNYYQWSNGIENDTVSLDTTNNYVLLVFDSLGFVHTDTILASIRDLYVDLGPDALDCDGDTLDAGIGFTSYVWSTGETTQMIFADSTNTYSVVAIDSFGCQRSDTVIISTMISNANWGPDGEVCEGVRLSGGSGIVTPHYSFLWNTGSGSPYLFPTAPGTFIVEYTSTSQPACMGIDTIIITAVNPNPVFSLPSDTSICDGSNLILDPGLSGMTYTWNTGDSSQTISASSTGLYALTLTNSFDCSETDDINVVVVDTLSMELGTNDSICDGSSVNLDAGLITATYLWNTGATSQSISVTTDGLYYVDLSKCSQTVRDSIYITVVANNLNLGADYSICSPNSTTLDAGAGYSLYKWNDNSSLQTLNVNSTGTYSVTVTEPVNACTFSDAINVTVNNPSVNLGADLIECESVTVMLDAGSGFTTYIWSSGETTQIISPTSSGNYTVTATDADGCSANDGVSVTLNSLPSINLGNDTNLCDTLTLTLDAGSGFSNYSWSNGLTNQIVNLNSSGTYTVTVTDVNGCENSDDITATFSSCTGIDESFNLNHIKLYPNPAHGKLMFEGMMEMEYHFNVINLLGESVLSVKTYENYLNLTDVPSGRYVVLINSKYNSVALPFTILK